MFLLLAVAVAAEPPPLGTAPFADPLRPIRYDYGARYQQLLAETMGGRLASPVFGPTVAEADLYWRFALETDRPPILSEDAPTRWRDAALAGSALALNRLVNETAARAPTLEAVQVGIDALLNPSLEIQRRDSGGLAVSHPVGGPAMRKVQAAEAAQGLEDVGPTPAAHMAAPLRAGPPPHLGTGVSWGLRGVDDPPESPLLRYTAWFSASNLGISNVRADLSVVDHTWSASAREQVYPRVYLYATTRSQADTSALGRDAFGVQWLIPRREGWNVRLERSWTWPEGDNAWMLTVRGENRTPIPARPGVSLGDGGLCLPPTVPHAASPLVPLNPPNALRRVDPTCDRLGVAPETAR